MSVPITNLEEEIDQIQELSNSEEEEKEEKEFLQLCTLIENSSYQSNHLDLSDSNLNDAQCIQLANALKSNCYISSIDISINLSITYIGFFSLLQKVRKIKLNRIGKELLASLANPNTSWPTVLNHVEELDCSDNRELGNAGFAALMRMMPNLIKVIADDIGLSSETWPLNFVLTRMKELDCSDNRELGNAGFAALMRVMPNLIKVIADDIGLSSETWPLNFVLTRMKELDCSDNRELGNAGFAALMRMMPNLIKVIANGIGLSSESWPLDFVLNCVEELDCSENSLTKAGFITLTKRMPNLIKIGARRIFLGLGKWPKDFILNRVKELDCSDNILLGNDEFAALTMKIPNLTKIIARNIDFGRLWPLNFALNCVEELDCSENPVLGNARFAELTMRMPNLVKIIARNTGLSITSYHSRKSVKYGGYDSKKWSTWSENFVLNHVKELDCSENPDLGYAGFAALTMRMPNLIMIIARNTGLGPKTWPKDFVLNHVKVLDCSINYNLQYDDLPALIKRIPNLITDDSVISLHRFYSNKIKSLIQNTKAQMEQQEWLRIFSDPDHERFYKTKNPNRKPYVPPLLFTILHETNNRFGWRDVFEYADLGCKGIAQSSNTPQTEASEAQRLKTNITHKDQTVVEQEESLKAKKSQSTI